MSIGVGCAVLVGMAAVAAEPIEVMVLGTYHMDNPGLDLSHMEADDVATPGRQRELEALAAALARFRPTRIAVEEEAAGPSFASAGYVGFTPEQLATNRNESAQIGYRLASRLGHATVHGIDEQPGEGEPDYFPLDPLLAYAEAHGEGERLAAMSAPLQAWLAAFEAKQETMSVPALLTELNGPKNELERIGVFYYEVLSLGDGEAQPGADLNAAWYLRNAKIFAKLTAVAEPGDRVLVVFGAGHSYWLKHFVRETPGFLLVDPQPYLRDAVRTARR
jgi:hypothetical protein